MKSIRLNKEIRSEIVANIKAAYINENTPPKCDDSTEENLTKVLIEHYMEINKDIIGIYNESKFKDYIHTKSYVGYVAPNGSHRWLNFRDSDNVEFKLPAPINSGSVFINLSNPDTIIPAAIAKVIKSNDKMKKTLRKQREALSKYELDLYKYIQEVRQVIDGVNTSKQLLEVWPEVEKFLPKGVTNPSRINLPAVSIASLNDKLGS